MKMRGMDAGQPVRANRITVVASHGALVVAGNVVFVVALVVAGARIFAGVQADVDRTLYARTPSAHSGSILPSVLQNSIVMAQDRRFYSHSGFDLFTALRALLIDVFHWRSTAGETIPQRTVRSLWPPASNWSDRLKQTLAVLVLERTASKDEILDLYASRVILGYRSGKPIVGVDEAADMYFGKPVLELDAAEAALIGAVSVDASYYNPLAHPARAQSRRNELLHTLFEENLLTKEQYETALRMPLALTGPPAR
jgi:membrane carboxypeptidase/penicillin-binding protein